jgi:hypothetical protein
MSLFRSLMSSDDECGHCKGCRWWQAEQDEADAAVGLCMQPELTHFSIQVSAHSGCNRFSHAPAEELVGAVNGV